MWSEGEETTIEVMVCKASVFSVGDLKVCKEGNCSSRVLGGDMGVTWGDLGVTWG